VIHEYRLPANRGDGPQTGLSSGAFYGEIAFRCGS